MTRSSVHGRYGSSEKYLLGVANFSWERRKGESTSIERQIVNGSINNADMVEWRGGVGGQRGGMVRARNRVSGRGRTITVCRLVFLPVTLHGRKERGKGRGEDGWKRSIGKFSVRSNSGAATFR